MLRMRCLVRKLLISNLLSSRIYTGPSDGLAFLSGSAFVTGDTDGNVDVVVVDETFISYDCGSIVLISSSSEPSRIGSFVGATESLNRFIRVDGISSGRFCVVSTITLSMVGCSDVAIVETGLVVRNRFGALLNPKSSVSVA